MLMLVRCLENHFVYEHFLSGLVYFLLKSNGARTDKIGPNKRGRQPLPFVRTFLNRDDLCFTNFLLSFCWRGIKLYITFSTQSQM